MKTKFAIALAVTGIVFFSAAAPTVFAATFSDDFSSGLRPAYWTVTQTTPGLFSVDDTQGDVRLAKVGNNPGGFQDVAINLNLAAVGGPISGDFSTQIDFSNAVIGPNNDQVQLNITVSGSPFDDVYDISCGPSSVHVWNGGLQGCMAVTGNSGTFKISRTGGTLTGYYNGSAIFSESNSSVVPTITFSLQLQPGSNDNTSVTFDNFSLTAASVPSACTPPPPQMVSWWPGDGNANDIQDGNNGTLMNGVTFVPGLVNQAFHFVSANTQFVQVPNASNLNFERTNPFTIDAWVRTTETSVNEFVLAKRLVNSPFTGYAILVNNGQRPLCFSNDPTPPGAGNLSFFLDGSSNGNCPRDHVVLVDGTTSLNDGQWHHVAVTYDGSSLAAGVTLYVDGALDSPTFVVDTLGTNSITNNADFTIGAGSGNGPQPFNGDIDEVEVFNRVLSQAEIQAIVHAGSFGKCRPQPSPTPTATSTPTPTPTGTPSSTPRTRATPTPRPRPTPPPRPTS